MFTWICNRLFTCCALLVLTGCLPGQGVAPFAGAKPLADNFVPLSKARMAGGKVLLAAPPGFCIEKSSVKPRFALMARCDVLGAPAAAGDAPLALIAISLIQTARGSRLPTPLETAQAAGLTGISDTFEGDEALIFRATGPAPLEGLATTHWRGTARIGGQILGVALYGPENGMAVTAEGRRIVADLINATRAES